MDDANTRDYFDSGRGLYSAAHAVAEAFNERRVDRIAALMHPDIRLLARAAARTLRGRGLVVNHLRRLFRDLWCPGPMRFAATEAMLPFGGRAYHPCALIYDGPRRDCAICPGLDAGTSADGERADILSLTILTEPSLLAAADRLGLPGFRDGASAAPLPRLIPSPREANGAARQQSQDTTDKKSNGTRRD